MAVKRTRKVKTVLPAPAEVSEFQPEEKAINKRKPGKLFIGIILLVLAVVFFWYKTNSWPIVAMVGMRPVTRFEVNQALFKQGGKTQVDDIVTEILVKKELAKNNINITDTQVNSKIADIRKSLGTSITLEDALAQRLMTMNDFKNQVKIQLGIEKLMSNKITITEAEINTYLQQNQAYMTSATGEAQRTEAESALKTSKLQTEVNNWITKLKADNKVWKLPGL